MKDSNKKADQEKRTDRITRREFSSFFLLGSLFGYLWRKNPLPALSKEAMFWKKTDAS